MGWSRLPAPVVVLVAARRRAVAPVVQGSPLTWRGARRQWSGRLLTMPRPAKMSTEDLLVQASGSVVPAVDRTPWEYGWSQADYRNSDLAALESPAGPVTLEPQGLVAYEEAVQRLGKEVAVRERWSDNELWGTVASLVVQASRATDLQRTVRSLLSDLRTATETLVLLAVSNVTWMGDPTLVAGSVLGVLGERMWQAIENAAAGRTSIGVEDLARLAAAYSGTDLTPSTSHHAVGLAVWCPGQSMLAVQQAERKLRHLLDLTLLLETNPPDLGLYSLRGPTNRPGMRGVALHRSAVEVGLKRAGALAELAADICVVSDGRARWHTHWHSTEPFPLGRLLEDSARRRDLAQCLRDDSPIARRATVAARWYAEAHWAADEDDAMLGLGVALDALIGSRRGLPGYAMRERFALLEPDVAKRAKRARRHAEIYSARSAVAHGSKSEALKEPGFVRQVASDVVWATYRMLALDELFSPTSDRRVDDCFEQLRWGTKVWS